MCRKFPASPSTEGDGERETLYLMSPLSTCWFLNVKISHSLTFFPLCNTLCYFFVHLCTPCVWERAHLLWGWDIDIQLAGAQISVVLLCCAWGHQRGAALPREALILKRAIHQTPPNTPWYAMVQVFIIWFVMFYPFLSTYGPSCWASQVSSAGY